MDKRQLDNYMDTCRKTMNTINSYKEEIKKEHSRLLHKGYDFFHGKNSGVRDIPTKEITHYNLVGEFFGSFLSSLPFAFMTYIIVFIIFNVVAVAIIKIIPYFELESKASFLSNYSTSFLYEFSF